MHGKGCQIYLLFLCEKQATFVNDLNLSQNNKRRRLELNILIVWKVFIELIIASGLVDGASW